ncbi:MAG TPA: DUF6049 family protein [Terrimesophilobacter sp.]|nr:DUF6049 family protein [Terrimesophilobacter sp.]HRQ00300.1 DUF6049 family protein [Terrimesophilobacter sp.]
MRITGSLLAIGLAVSGALTPATPAATETEPPAHPLSLVIVAPVTAPPAVVGVLDAPTLESLTTPGGLLATQLGQLGGREVTLAIDPMILASIRVLGRNAPTAATSWLTRLADAPNDTFALQWADANPAASLHAAGVVLDAPALTIDPTLFAPEGETTPDVASGDPVIPALPTQDDLVAWDYTHASIAWPADHTLTETDFAGLEQHGFNAAIVNSADIPRTPIKSPHVAFGAIDGIVSHDIASSLLRATIAAPTEEAWALAFEALTDTLAQLSESGERVLAATLGRIDPASPLRMSQTLDALNAIDWVTLAPLDAVFEQPAVSSSFEPAETSDDRASTMESLARIETDVITFSRIIDEPAPLLSTRRAKLLALLGAGWELDDGDWAAAAQEYLADSASILGAVTIQDSSTINLLAESGPFPVTVRNNLAHAVTVYITVQPDRPILQVKDFRVELKIPANTQAKALVPVQVVANGHLGTTVSLSAFDRTPIATPTRVELNVQAGWETPVTIIMVSLVGLMLLAGIWRTVRSRARAAAARTNPAGSATDPGSHE